MGRQRNGLVTRVLVDTDGIETMVKENSGDTSTQTSEEH
jgi:hypothetical protein